MHVLVCSVTVKRCMKLPDSRVCAQNTPSRSSGFLSEFCISTVLENSNSTLIHQNFSFSAESCGQYYGLWLILIQAFSFNFTWCFFFERKSKFRPLPWSDEVSGLALGQNPGFSLKKLRKRLTRALISVEAMHLSKQV